MSRKWVMYDRQTQDFAIYVDGELVGYARSYLEAEAVLDQLHMELLRARTERARRLSPNFDPDLPPSTQSGAPNGAPPAA